jgi:hypothetical protein
VICTPDAGAPPWLEPFDIVLPERCSAADLDVIGPVLRAAATVVGPQAALPGAAGLPYRAYATAAEREALLAAATGANVLRFRRPARLVGQWRAPLFGPLYLTADAPAITAPLTTRDPAAPTYVGRFIKRDRVTIPPRVNADFLANVIRITNAGERLPPDGIDAAVVAHRRGQTGADTGIALVLDVLSVA